MDRNGPWTLAAQLGQLKTGQDGKGLLQIHLWCPYDLLRLWDRIVLLYRKMLEYQVFNIWSHVHLLVVFEVFPETAAAASLFGDDIEQDKTRIFITNFRPT